MQKTIMIMLIGIPGSGKSYLANMLSEFLGAVIHSADDLREELYGNVNDVSKNTELFDELHRRIRKDVKNGQSVIVDATNIYNIHRKQFLHSIENIDCIKLSIYMMTPYEQCLKNNKSRKRIVPEDIIKNMWLNLEIPNKNEGFDESIAIMNIPLTKFDVK